MIQSSDWLGFQRFSIEAFCGFSSNQLYIQTPKPTTNRAATSRKSGLSSMIVGSATLANRKAPAVRGTIILKTTLAFLVLFAPMS